MSSDNGLLLGAEVAVPSQKNMKVKVVGCVVCAVAAGVLLGVAINGGNSANAVASEMSSGASETLALAVGASALTNANAIGYTRPIVGAPRANTFGDSATPWASKRPQVHTEAIPGRAVQDSLKTYGIGSSPLSDLAITAMDASNRDNRLRGVSMKASNEMVSGWNLVDQKTKEKLLKVIDEVKYKSSILAGVTGPMNFFDPLGFSTTVTAGKLLFYREVELKHGRIAMLAALGILVGEQFHPLFGGDIDVPSYIAFQQTPLETFWPAVVTAIAIPEIFSVATFQDPTKGGEQWAIKEDHQPGDLGFDPLGLKPKDPQAFKEMQTKELNNGRLAMIAVAGMIAQEVATGQKLF